MESIHNTSHFGVNCTLDLVSSKYYWPGLTNDVKQYVSTNTTYLTPSAELQIAQLYKPLIMSNGLLVSVVPIQQQQETNNCGLFSIAAAYHAAVRSDIGLLTFNESHLRAHLIKCFEQKKLTRFPQSKRLCVTRPASQNFVIVVYCPCKKPDSFQNMIQCDQCGVWFHYTCASRKAP